MNLKKNIIIILVSIILYIMFNFIYQKLVYPNKTFVMYVLAEDVAKGEKVDMSKMIKLEYEAKNQIDEFVLPNVNEELYYSQNYSAYEIITSSKLSNKEELLNNSENMEIIGIKVDSLENNLCSNIKRGDVVNLYASGKKEEMQRIVNIEDIKSFGADISSGMYTVKLLENVNIIGCYDSDGNKIKEKGKIDTVIIEVNKDMALKINNLKTYAKFSLAIGV